MTDHATPFDIEALMTRMGHAARAAAHVLKTSEAARRNAALTHAAATLRAQADAILAANARDLGEAAGLTPAARDRLELTPARIAAMAAGLEAVAALPDPVGRTLKRWSRPNGLAFERVSVPIGVIAMIYESRPNVTADAGALCLKSGNAVILRGGSESLASSKAIHACLAAGLEAAGLPAGAIALVPTPDRAAVGLLLQGLAGHVDLVIPRGGKSLVARVQAEARVPVLAHLDGNNHVYVHAAADLAMARRIVLNAKMRRTGVCGAAETLLVDRAVAATHLPPLAADLMAAGCALRGDPGACALVPDMRPATDADWATEYLDAVLAVRVVDGLEAAIAHVETWGSHHTDAIVTEDAAAAERFLAAVDSAIVLWNASTQFADGAEFGFGAEIGIATGRLHARGPVALEELTTYRTLVRGAGQIRP